MTVMAAGGRGSHPYVMVRLDRTIRTGWVSWGMVRSSRTMTMKGTRHSPLDKDAPLTETATGTGVMPAWI
jgi:hypothetical protein